MGSNLNDSHNAGGSLIVNKVNDQDLDLTDCGRFIQWVKKTLIMFIVETKFIGKLIDKDKTIAYKIIDRIFDPVLKYLVHEAEVINKFFFKAYVLVFD